MTTQEMFLDSLSDAISDAINQLGGAKRVGTMLWPEKSAREAGNQLLNCLNPDHAQKLSLEQIDFIVGEARKKDVHSVAVYIADKYCYEPPKPITKESLKADIDRQLGNKLSEIEDLVRQLKKLK